VPRLFLDLSELISNPLRTGIQRVERKIIEHWPGELPTPVFVNGRGEFKSLYHDIYETLLLDTPNERSVAISREFERALSEASPFAGGRRDVVLNLELFFNVPRSNAYRSLASSGVSAAWYIHDFIPFLKPTHFAADAALNGMPYLRALRDIGDGLSFNSCQSRDDCANRILRRPEGVRLWPVFSCGADGFGIERQSFHPNRVNFVSIGTMEKRKNTVALIQAFEALWESGNEANLVLAGRFGADDPDLRQMIERNRGNRHFKYLSEPSDAILRDELTKARALVMPSEIEGFGIPPIEAVFVGIPAILSQEIPSAKLISGGAIQLKRVDAASLIDAVRSMQDDTVARRLWTQTAEVVLPTWRDMASQMAAWVNNRLIT
jgi:glycosyltransferase involved in cell wall biosynthesis